MTPHITYNAGKFFDEHGNEIVNPEVLCLIDINLIYPVNKWIKLYIDDPGYDGLNTGDKISLPATLRAEVEYQIKGPSGDWVTASKGDYEFYHPARKVVRLVEVDSKAEPLVSLPKDTEKPSNQTGKPSKLSKPEKQAIDERVEEKRPGMEEVKMYRFEATIIENALRLAMRVLDSRSPAHQTAMDRELLRAEEYIKKCLSSQPPPQAESQEEIFDDLFSQYFKLIHDSFSMSEAVKKLGTKFTLTRNTKP